jgi:hypothetical protein
MVVAWCLCVCVWQQALADGDTAVLVVYSPHPTEPRRVWFNDVFLRMFGTQGWDNGNFTTAMAWAL